MHWLRDNGIGAEKEQEIPQWNHGTERAILDVVYHEGASGMVAMDVTVTDMTANAHGGQPWRHALARKERKKHTRYPGPELVPFVVDVRGRWGKEAEAWMKRVAKRLAAEQRTEAVRACRYEVSLALQAAVAEQLASCHGAR